MVTSTAVQTADYSCYYRMDPAQTDHDGAKHWITRAANFVVVSSQVNAGSVLERHNDDEYFILLPANTPALIETDNEKVETKGDALFIAPPGKSRVLMHGAGYIYRVFSQRATDLLALADNASSYAQGAPGVAPLVDWPAPRGGYRLRHYPLADYIREDTTMRLFRTSNLMINVFVPGKAPRPLNKMTPHFHIDFEQGSLAIAGTYVHHLRYPWTADKTAWKDDQHIEVHSPSLLIIPPTVIHTSQSMTVGANLIDIFAPPREDFSLRPGLVCNEDDYPLPDKLQK